MVWGEMPTSAEPLIAIAVGIGLAAATGLRVFLPLLVAGLASRWGALPLADGFGWLDSDVALLALGAASVIEIAAYYIPGVDHLLDLLSGPAAFTAGTVASASVMTDLPPAVTWPVALIGGGGMAAATKLGTAVVRAKTGIATAGLGNPIIATIETAGALVIGVIALVVPLITLAMLFLLVFWIRRWRRRRAAVVYTSGR